VDRARAWELRARTPFLDVRLLASNKALTSTYLRYGLVLLCVYVVLYGITQWVEGVLGLSETEAGLLLLPMTLVSGLVISPVSRRNLVRGPVIAAAFACLIASAGVLFLSASAWIGPVVVITVIFGLAMGFAGAGNQTALYSQAPADQLGTASGLLRTFGYVGSIASSAITGVVFHTSVTDSGDRSSSLVQVRTSGRPPARGYMLSVVVPVAAGSAGRAQSSPGMCEHVDGRLSRPTSRTPGPWEGPPCPNHRVHFPISPASVT
jgi:MFS family permease